MLNIVKSDFYKLKKSKAFWVCTALFTFISMTMRASGGAIATNIVCVTMAATILDAISMLLFGGLGGRNHHHRVGTV